MKKTILTLAAAIAGASSLMAYDVIVANADGQKFRASANSVETITFEAEGSPITFTGLTDNDIYLGLKAAEASVEFNAQMYWIVKDGPDADWLTLGITAGLAGDNSLPFTVEANNTGADRTASFTLLCGFTEVEFTVTQTDDPSASFVKIPDPAFLALLLKDYDRDSNGSISSEEALEIKNLNVSRSEITSLEGIRHFANLEVLDCSNNSISGTLNLSGLAKLRELKCGYNAYNSLNLAGCSALQTLYANDNVVYTNGLPSFKMTSIDLTGCSALTYINLQDNALTAIDLTPCTALEDLHLELNSIGAIDLTKCPKLIWAHIRNNSLGGGAVDFSHCPEIRGIFASNMELGDINLAGCTQLRELSVQNNSLTALEFPDSPELESLTAFNNQISALNVAHCPNLTNLWASFNKLTALDLTENSDLKVLSIGWNPDLAGRLDLTNCPNLTELAVQSTQVTAIDMAMCDRLATIDVNDSRLTSFDASNAPWVYSLSANGNQLTEINVSECPDLEYLCLNDNKLTSLDVTKNRMLYILEIENNLIGELDLSNCHNLSELLAKNNKLTSVDLTDCWSLSTAELYDNLLTQLNVDDCESLSELHFQNNLLTSFDPSKCSALRYVDCRNNDLGPELDFCYNDALDYVFGTSNPRMVQVYLSDVAPNTHIEFDSTVTINLKRK